MSLRTSPEKKACSGQKDNVLRESEVLDHLYNAQWQGMPDGTAAMPASEAILPITAALGSRNARRLEAVVAVGRSVLTNVWERTSHLCGGTCSDNANVTVRSNILHGHYPEAVRSKIEAHNKRTEDHARLRRMQVELEATLGGRFQGHNVINTLTLCVHMGNMDAADRVRKEFHVSDDSFNRAVERVLKSKNEEMSASERDKNHLEWEHQLDRAEFRFKTFCKNVWGTCLRETRLLLPARAAGRRQGGLGLEIAVLVVAAAVIWAACSVRRPRRGLMAS